MHFIRSHMDGGLFKYREQIKNNALRGQFYLRVDLRDLQTFDEDLYMTFRNNPVEYIKVFEAAIETIYRNDIYDISNPDLEEAPRFQVQFSSDENPVTLRELTS